MYLPNYTRQDDSELIYEFIESHPFATVVTTLDGETTANHLPIVNLKINDGFKLIGHIAKSNPQWRHFDANLKVLIIFQGPHAYISPSVYENKLNVPTWNYTAVHICGKVKVTHEFSEIEKILETSVKRFESCRENPWSYSLPQDFREKLVSAIVGFEILPEKIEGKFKLSQNRDTKDYEGVVKAFSRDLDSNSKELLKYMKLVSK